MKYTAKIHINPDTPNLAYVGQVTANTLSELRRKVLHGVSFIRRHMTRKTVHVSAEKENGGIIEFYMRLK